MPLLMANGPQPLEPLAFLITGAFQRGITHFLVRKMPGHMAQKPLFSSIARANDFNAMACLLFLEEPFYRGDLHARLVNGM